MWRCLAIVVAAMLVAGTSRAKTPSCAGACKKPQFTKAAKKACTAECEKTKTACKKNRKCRKKASLCAQQCATAWGGTEEGAQRIACQGTCNSCTPVGQELCLSYEGDGDGTVASRCCGGDSGRPCCGQEIDRPGVSICCSGVFMCCPLPGRTDGAVACPFASEDERNCGQCGNVCPPAVFPDLTTCCGGKCVDLETDYNNCGQCGTTCARDQRCQNGNCVDPCAAFADTVYCPARPSGFQCCPMQGAVCCPDSGGPCKDEQPLAGDDPKCCYQDVGTSRYGWLCGATDSCCNGAAGFLPEGCCPTGLPDIGCYPNPLIPGLNYCGNAPP